MTHNLLNDKYKLYVRFELLKNIPSIIDGYLEIAKIRNISQRKDIMFVLYDKNHYDNNNYMLYAKVIKKDGKDYWCAIVRDEFLERMQKNVKIASFGIFHELGHFISGDFVNKKNITSEDLSKLRRNALENGEVLEMETKADEFAVNQVGKSCAINFLDYSIMRRKKIDNSKLAILELELRKKHIKNLK